MKKLLMIPMVIFIGLISFYSALADTVSFDSIDLSEYSVTELIMLRNRINDEITSRDENNTQSENQLTTDKEIKFNDFVWGMDAKTALKILIEKNLVESDASIKGPTSVEPWGIEYYNMERSYEDSGLYISEWCWVLKISQNVSKLLRHPVTEQINSLSAAAPEAPLAPLAC